MRWRAPKTGLFSRLQEQFKRASSPDAIRAACLSPLVERLDLYVFEHCAREALRRPLFADNSVASLVIYVSVLVRDLINRQHRVERLTHSDDKNLLMTEWDELRVRVSVLDDNLCRLFVHIKYQYQAYLRTSEFWRRQVTHEERDRVLEQARGWRSISPN